MCIYPSGKDGQQVDMPMSGAFDRYWWKYSCIIQ